jgi:nucleotide-binding universal stress UspA family protein
MQSEFEFNTLLVPTDFSPSARVAFQRAVGMACGDDPLIILLHVIDHSLIDFACQHEFATQEAATQAARAWAERKLEEFLVDVKPRVEVRTIICEGQPFLEILKKAEEFLVDAIVMGKIGVRGSLEKLLFGSTAERVLRGATRPVVVLPVESL